MLYPSRDSGIQYRGIRNASYMIRFLHNVMNPIVRITRTEQLMELLVNYDVSIKKTIHSSGLFYGAERLAIPRPLLQAVMVGYFNFTRLDRTPGYREFYKAAVRALERDPNRELVFAIVTGASFSEAEHNVYKFPSANLHMWNESLVSMRKYFYTCVYTMYIWDT